ncbi:unnamed protein product [Ectocarpus sp. 4 AP-2014]
MLVNHMETHQIAPHMRGKQRACTHDRQNKVQAAYNRWTSMSQARRPFIPGLGLRIPRPPRPLANLETERLFSCAGNIVTKNRNKLASTTVELLVLLRHSRKIVEEASNAAARGVRGGST